MKRSWILTSAVVLALAGGACGEPPNPEPVYIQDFAARSPVLACEPLPHLSAEGLVVEDLVPVSGGETLVLSSRTREVLVLDPAAAPRWRLALEEEGPRGVGSPISLDLQEDGSLVVADRGRQLLKRLGPDGEDRGTVRTPFFPSVVRITGSGTWVIPGVVAGYPDRLLYRLVDGDVRPEGLELRSYPGMTHGAFANRLGAARRPDGRLLLLHAFYIPEAYLWGEGEVARYRVPVPDDLRPLFRDPRPVEREEDLPRLPVVGLSPFLDPGTGDLVYLTRTGAASAGGASQKALIRVDSLFRYRSSGILPVDALHAAPMGPASVLVVSNGGIWHRCNAP